MEKKKELVFHGFVSDQSEREREREGGREGGSD